MQTANNILLVRVPAQEAVDGRELRDYILESLARGVLVLTEDASCEVLELPPLGGVEVVSGEQELPVPDSGPPATRETGTGSEPEGTKPGNAIGRNAEEKRMIMTRLAAYRKAHGLGSWAPVVKASRGRLSDDQLWGMAAGAVKLPISEWRLAAKALDKLERQEKEQSN